MKLHTLTGGFAWSLAANAPRFQVETAEFAVLPAH
jgi:hypothetical protein